jgi:hypothetical protein
LYDSGKKVVLELLTLGLEMVVKALVDFPQSFPELRMKVVFD